MECEAALDAAPAAAAPLPARSTKSKGVGEHVKKREYAKWTRSEEDAFFTAVKESGRADLARIAPKVPTKTKDQIRCYYHRVLRRVNHLLAPLTDCVDSYDTDEVRLALLSWWSMQRKRGAEGWTRSLADEKKRNVFARGLRDLVVTNRRRLALKRQKAAAADADADVLPALAGEATAFGGASCVQHPAASVTPLSLPHTAAGAAWRPTLSADGGLAGSLDLNTLPPQLRLQLFPVDEATLAAVSAAGWNPHLELTFKARKSIASLLTHLASKWAGAAAQLQLPPHAALRFFPMLIDSPSEHAGWGLEAGALMVASLMLNSAVEVTAPGAFRLKYGWTVTPMPPPMLPPPPPPAAPEAPPAACAMPPVHAPPPPPVWPPAPSAPVATPCSLLSMLMEPTQPPLPQRPSHASAGATATPITPAVPDGAAQHGRQQEPPAVVVDAARVARLDTLGDGQSNLDALFQEWAANPAQILGARRTNPASSLRPPELSCSLLPDMYLGELSDAEHELIRDLRPASRAARPNAHTGAPAAAPAAAPLPDFGASMRGFSVLGGLDGMGDIFMGIGSLLGAEPSWQAPLSLAVDRRASRLAPQAGVLANAPASFAGICDILRGGAPK